jgi:hypothetical protein
MSLSTRTVLSSLGRPKISPEVITAIITLLQTLELETKKLLGSVQLENLKSGVFNKKAFEEFTDLGNLPVEKLPGFPAAINKFQQFKLSLPLDQQSQLDKTLIQLPTLLGYTRIERFGDICFSKSPNRTPEQSCIFTSQIFLWQLIVNAGTEAQQAIQIPDVVRNLAKVLFCDIRPLAHVENISATVNPKYCRSEAILIPNVSYRDQLRQLKGQLGSSAKTPPYDGKILLFKLSKKDRKAAKRKQVANSGTNLSAIVEEESAIDSREVISCKA